MRLASSMALTGDVMAVTLAALAAVIVLVWFGC
jgi:hypothetical protein